jgi:pilus assembly protein Flp/PilA
MRILVTNFLKDESGATAIEYALITIIVAVGIIASLTVLRDQLNSVFDVIAGGFVN